jgi:cytidine deaminase
MNASKNNNLQANTEDELIFGIVSPVGTEYNRVTRPLFDYLLKEFGYEVKEIRLSESLPSFNGKKNEYRRIKHLMNAGNQMREDHGNDILARFAIKEICKCREDLKNNLENDLKGSSSKRAYIVNSLKHPEEVELLRKVYSKRFYLIGIHADKERRLSYLTKNRHVNEKEAQELISTDEDELLNYGQKTRDTYHLSDFFLSLGSLCDQVNNSLKRFLDLIFSNPYINPTFDEFAMFMAFSSSARSGDLSRQVGTVISREQQIIATGANDVPKAGGGLYCSEYNRITQKIEDDEDGKDYKRGYDSNKKEQGLIIDGIYKKLLDEKIIQDDPDNKEKICDILKESKISDLIEFSRAIHSEMDALLSCSRAGIPTLGATLYCTTLPCHNCAKHIVASGISRVIYVEPYPKSLAFYLHSDSITLKTSFEEDSNKKTKSVIFEPFIGVGARRFLDLFSMRLGSGSNLIRKEKSGKICEWKESNARPRNTLIENSYLDFEKDIGKSLPKGQN